MAAATGDRPRRVLIVDDERDLVRVLEHALSDAGYRVECAYDGVEGLVRIERDPPDLVLLDVELPGVDGLAICARVRECPALRSLPLLLITARGAAVDVFRGLTSGATDYLVKPFALRELLARAAEALGRVP